MSDWDGWRFALALARTGRFADAAADLGVEVSTVRRRIKELNQRLGVEVFGRVGNVYAPREACMSLIEAADRIEGEMAGIERNIGFDRAPSLTGSLRIVISDDLTESLLDPYFVSFHQSHPGVRLDLIRSGHGRSLGHYEADVAFLSLPPREDDRAAGQRISAIAWSCYASRRYFDEHVELLGLRPGHRSCNPMDLIPNVVWAPHARPAVRRWLNENARQAHPGVRSASLLTYRSLALAGTGAAILPCYLGDAEPDLVQLIPPIEALAGELWIVSHAQVRQTARVRAMFEHFAHLAPEDRDRLAGRPQPPPPRRRTRSRR